MIIMMLSSVSFFTFSQETPVTEQEQELLNAETVLGEFKGDTNSKEFKTLNYFFPDFFIKFIPGRVNFYDVVFTVIKIN